jgi:hypothetical protein
VTSRRVIRNVGYPSSSSFWLYTAFPVICIQILGSIFQADNASCTPENLIYFLMAYPIAKLKTLEFKVISLFYPTVKWKYKQPTGEPSVSLSLNTQQHVQHVQFKQYSFIESTTARRVYINCVIQDVLLLWGCSWTSFLHSKLCLFWSAHACSVPH